MVQAIVSTGALMAHGLSEAVGLTHYRHDPRMSDEELFEKGYNRVHDTLEMEANLNYVEEFTARALDALGPDVELSSEMICRALGKVLAENPQGQGALRSAYLKQVPIYVPAFTDSELGLDLATWSMKRAQSRGVRDPQELFATLPRYNPYLDLNSFARLALSAKRLGIFTIGGGVPRNWAQEIGPYVEIANHRLGLELTPPRYQYAVRICPEPTHWGGLSGCTYSEGVSLGQVRPAGGGRALRRGLRRRHHRLAAADQGRARGAGGRLSSAAVHIVQRRRAEVSSARAAERFPVVVSRRIHSDARRSLTIDAQRSAPHSRIGLECAADVQALRRHRDRRRPQRPRHRRLPGPRRAHGARARAAPRAGRRGGHRGSLPRLPLLGLLVRGLAAAAGDHPRARPAPPRPRDPPARRHLHADARRRPPAGA